MKTTFATFKPSTSPTKKPVLGAFEIFYHTILPCIITYLIIKHELPFLLIMLVVPIFIRFKPEEIKRK